jgi:hypothetical protein
VRHALVALALAFALAAAGCGAVTEVHVSVENRDLAGVQTLRLTVSNPELSLVPIYDSQPLPMCQAGGTGACYRFPVSLTLVPGAADARVRVEVDALTTGDAPLTSQASLFKFVSGVRQQLRFILYGTCGGQLCAGSDLGCNAAGQCEEVDPTGAPPGSGGIHRVKTYEGSTGGGATFMLAPPQVAQPGDQVIVLAASAFVDADPSWTALHTFNGGTNYNLFHRQARAGEASDVAGYTFLSDQPAQNLVWFMAVYRGAQSLDDVLTDVLNSPYVYPSAPTADEALFVAIAIPGLNAGVCQMSPAPDGKVLGNAFDLYEIVAHAGTSTGDRTVTCTSADPAGAFVVRLH